METTAGRLSAAGGFDPRTYQARPVSRRAADPLTQRIYPAICIATLGVLPLDFFPGLPLYGFYIKLLFITTGISLVFLPKLFPAPKASIFILSVVGTAYLFRALILSASLSWSSNPSLGMTMLGIEALSLVLAVPVMIILGQYQLGQLTRIVLWGALAGAIVFHLFLAFGHLRAGRISILVLLDALASGEFRMIKLQYFVGGLRGLGVQGVAGVWGSVAPKITNAFGNAMITPAVLAFHLAAADKMINGTASTARRLALWIVVGNAVLVSLFAFSSRVQVYALVIILGHVYFHGFLGANARARFVILFGTVFGAGAAVLYMLYNIVALGGLESFIDNFLNDPRFNDLYETIYRVSSSGFLGDGFGTALNLTGATNVFAHNLFMSDLLAGGFLGLAAASGWCGALVYCSIIAFRIMVDRKLPFPVRRIGAACMMTIFYNVLLLQLTSRGSLDLSDCVGLALSLGVLISLIRLAERAKAVASRSPVQDDLPVPAAA